MGELILYRREVLEKVKQYVSGKKQAILFYLNLMHTEQLNLRRALIAEAIAKRVCVNPDFAFLGSLVSDIMGEKFSEKTEDCENRQDVENFLVNFGGGPIFIACCAGLQYKLEKRKGSLTTKDFSTWLKLRFSGRMLKTIKRVAFVIKVSDAIERFISKKNVFAANSKEGTNCDEIKRDFLKLFDVHSDIITIASEEVVKILKKEGAEN